jgi:D-glycero-D-manno-heptose 1,7-bisphosphate phosphatase
MGIGCCRVREAVSRRAVFLDRDGVLIEASKRDGSPYPVRTPDEVRLIDGVPEACAQLSALGFLLVMITNQPDVARGKVTRAFVDAVNSGLSRSLGLDAVRVCIHDDADDCDCRKPRPGMILDAAATLSIALHSSFFVGDRWRDIDAGHSAGCKTVLIDHGYDEPLRALPDHVAPSLLVAAEWIRSQV